jgi:hypothetical protein
VTFGRKGILRSFRPSPRTACASVVTFCAECCRPSDFFSWTIPLALSSIPFQVGVQFFAGSCSFLHLCGRLSGSGEPRAIISVHRQTENSKLCTKGRSGQSSVVKGPLIRRPEERYTYRGVTGRQGRQPNASYRSVGLANFVKNLTIFRVSSTGRLQGSRSNLCQAPFGLSHQIDLPPLGFVHLLA